MKIQPVRGTRDIYGEQAQLFHHIQSQFRKWAEIFNFQPMETPIFEFSQVFQRSLGDQTDIVNKEMYTFTDRSGDSITLRPEGTASIARSIVSNSLLRDLPLKLYYSGPMFRHERPQKGRYRQFYQFGIELLGVESHLADIEVLSCAWAFFKSCNLEGKIQLEINSLGDKESRDQYRAQLTQHFSKVKSQLSEDSQRRLETNPLRILDSKDDVDQKWIASAPNLESCLNAPSREVYENILKGLDELGIPYNKNPRLVRGLDYYNHCVFEFTTTHLGSQNAVLSGGRYNNLVEALGGPSTPGVGWAAGTDRLALLLEDQHQEKSSVAIIAPDPSLQMAALKRLNELRLSGIPSQMMYSGNLSKQLKKASKRHCRHALIIGAEELKSGLYTLKDLKSGQQNQVPWDELLNQLKVEYV